MTCLLLGVGFDVYKIFNDSPNFFSFKPRRQGCVWTAIRRLLKAILLSELDFSTTSNCWKETFFLISKLCTHD